MDTRDYIRIPAITKKLDEAKKENRILYINGATGYGKTSAVLNYYKDIHICMLDGANGYLDKMPDADQINEDVIFIDNTSFILEEKSKSYIQHLIISCKKHIIIVGRGRLPYWLSIYAVEQDFLYAGEEDLKFSEPELKQLLKIKRLSLTQAEVKTLLAFSKGHPVYILYSIKSLINGIYQKEEDSTDSTSVNTLDSNLTNRINERFKLEIGQDMFYYFDSQIYNKWDSDMINVLLNVCLYPTFTAEMAEFITGNEKTMQVLERAIYIGNFLTKVDNENYCYRPELRNFFVKKQAILYTKDEINLGVERAALFYEQHDDLLNAIKYYDRICKYDKVSMLLEKNAVNHPGIAHFYEMREYYYNIPEKTALDSPSLMCGLSMLYSITLMVDESEKWYNHLKCFSEDKRRTQISRRAAKEKLIYLDIALPHRGIKGIIDILKKAAMICTQKGAKLPAFSVTGNIPSLMNGGLDFCEWSRNDKELGIAMKKPIEIVLGNQGIGLINIALAESGFEKSINGYI